ncbi:MAG: DeoR/GlpR family DNA-binding transcription regulator [Micropruina sp.]|uniref:DeoR/GlpR family DNA-binding transcription regulator n=1 Tax=Micropruina sp. TaxID=2737536 RepID=UPI0039E6C23E
MDIEERHTAIVQLLQSKKSVKALALSKLFDVSPETIRKDLMDLHERGLLVRVHGGARIRPTEKESAYERRMSVHRAAKQAIAAAALAGIEEGSTVYIDYGTTTYALADALVQAKRRVRVLTNALPIATRLSRSETVETIVLGGMVRGNEGSLFGPIAEKALESVYMDVGFFGCAGIDALAGVTNHHALEGATSQKAMSHCRSVVVLAAEDKLDTIAVNRLADLSQLDLVITTGTPGSELSRALTEADVSVVIAQEESLGIS